MNAQGHPPRSADHTRGFNRSAPSQLVLRWHSLAMLPGFVWLVVFALRAATTPDGLRFTLFDDAMISMSYARTLAQTGELVFFPGAERVQGFTNPLWTLWMAGLHLFGLGGSSAALAVSLTSGLSIILVGYLVGRLVWWTNQSPLGLLSSSFAAGTVPFLYPFIFWSLRGMEVAAYSLFMLLLIAGNFKLGGVNGRALYFWASSVLLISTLGILTRFDFVIFAGTLFLPFLFRPQTGNRVKILIFANSLGVLAGVAITLTSQKIYFGEWLPNTYHLKMDGFTILERVLPSGVASASKALALLALAVLSIYARRFLDRHQTVPPILLSTLLALLVAGLYSVWVGGDAWENSGMLNRFLSAALPAALVPIFANVRYVMRVAVQMSAQSLLSVVIIGFVLLSAFGVRLVPLDFDIRRALVVWGGFALVLFLIHLAKLPRLTKMTSHNIASSKPEILAALAVMVSASLLPAGHWLLAGGTGVKTDQQMVTLGLELKSATLPGALVGVTWAGNPPYYAERRVADFLGKNDNHVALTAPRSTLGTSYIDFWPGHNKWDYEHSIGSLKPDLIFQTWVQDESLDQLLVEGGYLTCTMPQSRHPVYVRPDSSQLSESMRSHCFTTGRNTNATGF